MTMTIIPRMIPMAEITKKLANMNKPMIAIRSKQECGVEDHGCPVQLFATAARWCCGRVHHVWSPRGRTRSGHPRLCQALRQTKEGVDGRNKSGHGDRGLVEDC